MSSFHLAPEPQRLSQAMAVNMETVRPTPTHSIILPRKRRKVRLACNPCRQTKTRCDGHQPSCSTCASKGVSEHCVYEKETLKTQRYVAILEERVKELETGNPRASDRDGDRSPYDSEAGGMSIYGAKDILCCRDQNEIWGAHGISWVVLNSEGRSYLDYTGPRLHQSPRTNGALDRQRSVAGPSEDPLNRLDALVMVPSPEASLCDGGGTSVTSFLRSIAHIVGMDEMADRALPRTGKSTSTPQDDSSANNGPGIFLMPTRRIADALMLHFWSYVHPIFPILHKPTFVSIYESLWIPDADISHRGSCIDSPVTQAILNIAFALGCKRGDQEDLAERFYRKSRQYYSADAVDLPSLETVQLLLLTGIYLQSTKYASRCWSVVGLAIRYAQYLGLHLEDHGQIPRSQLEQEMRCRVWHSCVMIDRLLSLSFNQPSMTSGQGNVRLPSMTDDENLAASDGQGPVDQAHTTSQMAFFVYSIKLFEILNKSLILLYHTSSTERQAEPDPHRWWSRAHLEHVSTLNRTLDDLSVELPVHLRPTCHIDATDTLLRRTLWQGYIFRSRFLYVRILVLRPVLLSAAAARTKFKDLEDRPGVEETLEESSAVKTCSLCVATVHSLVKHMFESLGRVSEDASWREVHYTFVCAMVLLAARLCPFKSEAFNENILNRSWLHCLTILDRFKRQIYSVKTGMQMLHSLESHVSQITTMKRARVVTTPPPQENYVNADHLSQSPGSANFLDDIIPPTELDFDSLDDFWLRGQIGNLGWLG
ncbi:hypothetical protein BO86DRAFT_368945 [Aspergillus japonicus CBS 114.51]|uniref:Zn(2)-C6 fungal-type domain-containing protein n=1 Tax=Aspergillus japonicus CBS 114.51 TaxID=1448312 RepID=A0A8T8WR74_ASPJA|nr:hypothetical protein BO86DRAFT_368945 [Aspergillus japonicus CBS 114.51]RAH78358.1 hypothetical protein BO86DRAFT_368945 [Aspergillus japonicus CBS 114.51]